MNKRFNYTEFDRRSHRITAVVITVIVLLLLLSLYYIQTSYFTAWIIANLLAVAGLFILSIPRYVEVTGDAIEINCIVELTRIPYKDLLSVRRMEEGEMSRAIPLLGSYGFFGYYGYYLDLRRWNMMKVYTPQWNNFIEIEDIYEQKYVISCPDPEAFLTAVKEAQAQCDLV